jgi:hypothetical protein
MQIFEMAHLRNLQICDSGMTQELSNLWFADFKKISCPPLQYSIYFFHIWLIAINHCIEYMHLGTSLGHLLSDDGL